MTERDETLDGWLAQQIVYAENERGMLRSYRAGTEIVEARLATLKEVQEKMLELWGNSRAHGEEGNKT